MIIYVLKDPFTQEIRYIGKTTKELRKRWYAHTHLRESTKQRHIYRWIESLKTRGALPIAEQIAEASSYDELNELEKVCIAFARDIGLSLTNISAGGDGSVGFKRSPETIAKMRLAQGSLEARARKSRDAKNRTPEFLANIHAKNNKPIYCSDGRFFKNATEAAEFLGQSHKTTYRAATGKIGRIFRKLGIRLSYEPFENITYRASS